MPIFPGHRANDSVYAAAGAYAIERASGRSSADAGRMIGDRYRGLAAHEVILAATLGESAYASGRAYSTGVARTIGPSTVLPIDPTQPEQYRYIVQAEFEKGLSARPQYRNIIVDSDVPLSQADLAAAVETELATSVASGAASLPGGAGPANAGSVSVTVSGITTQS